MARALAAVSLALLAARLYAASVVGFGDSEALYAAWALHPQPAYLDHPGLVALFARAIGEGAAPSPGRAHVVTAIVATLVPWIAYAAARAAGSTARAAGVAGLVVALTPVVGVGLFGMTPDLLLAPLWLGALAFACAGARGWKPDVSLLAAGLLAGVAGATKAPGVLLAAGLAIAWARATWRTKALSVWPWAGLAAGLVTLLPIATYEQSLGWPMLQHRLVDTQAGAGPSLRNVAAIVGGQLAYLSPLVAVLVVLVARDLWRRRDDDEVSRLLFAVFATTLAPLLFLCVWSRVAEPHWLAPAWLPLVVHGARRGGELFGARRKLVAFAVATAGVFTLAAHVYVLVPATARLAPDASDPRLDIASELYGWPDVLTATREAMRSAATPFDPEGREVVVVGPHWTICGQLAAGLPGIRVGCATEIPDDFDGWLPRPTWRAAENVLFVTDARFPEGGSAQLPAHVLLGRREVLVRRGGRVTRRFTLSLFGRRDSAQL